LTGNGMQDGSSQSNGTCRSSTCSEGSQSNSSSSRWIEGWGPTVAFNLRRPDGSWVGYHEVGEEMYRVFQIAPKLAIKQLFVLL
jgi:hypothetical protein